MATTKGPKRVRPRPRPSTAAPLSSPGAAAVVVAAGGATLRGPGDDGLLWLSLARSLGRWSCCRRFSMSWWRRPTLWLSCCRRFSMSWCRRTTHSGCWPTPMLIRAALRCPAPLCSATARHDRPAFESPRPPDTATRSVSRGASQERRGPTACVGGCAASGEPRRADGPWPRRQALAASSVLQAAAGSVGLLAGAPSRRLPDRARSPPCLPVCGPSLSCLESAALLLVNQQPARPSPGQPARSLTTLRHVRPSCRLATSLAAEPATRRRAGLAGRGKDRCCCRSDIPLWLWRTAAAALSCLVVAIAAPGTGGAGGHKNRKKEQRVGGALFCAGPPATRGPPSAEQEPMGSTLRSRRGAGCCPSFLHSAQLTAAEPCASPCLPPLSAWATAR